MACDVARLRAAAGDDLEALLAIHRTAFVRPWTRATLREELGRPDRVWVVTEVGGSVVGYAGAADLAGEAHVLSLAVAVEHRRHGHARDLVAELLAAASERFGCGRATLEVRESNLAARELYRRCGFVEAGVRPGYYQHDGEAAVVLWCEDVPAAIAGLGRPRWVDVGPDDSADRDPLRRHRHQEDTP
jgi:ribosomal-protein-alanine N-acetyltransferase